jgi:hypothetical protein
MSPTPPPAATLSQQAQQAMVEVPTPELVIIQTIDGDMNTCPLDNAEVARFGENVTIALEQIAAASPQSRILMITGFIRPDPAYDEQAVAAYPESEAEATGTPGECCIPFVAPGEVNTAFFDMLTVRLKAFEAEQQRRCDAVPQCRTDDGVRAPYFFKVDHHNPMMNHLNVRGLAVQAELVWPVVVDVLGLDVSIDRTVPSTEPS